MSTTLCRHCEEREASYYNVQGVEICDQCAERIANAWWERHSGRWLTWRNPPASTRCKAKISRRLAKQVFERDAYRCVSCNGHVDLTCDHVVPESKGGPTVLDNLQTMCRSCNSKKGARHA